MQVIDFIDFNSVTSALSGNPMMKHLFLAVTDLDGNALTSTPWRRVCRDFHRVNANTNTKCLQSDKVLANSLNHGESYALYTCFNNLTDAATPIVVEGERIGNLVVGQVFLAPPDMDFFMRQAVESGFDREEYLAAISEVPVVEESELRDVMQFYSGITSMVGKIARQARSYKEMTDRLVQRTAELEYVNKELEAFSYSVSHDLRAPLRHITGFIELFNRRYAGALPEDGKHYFEVIHESAGRMSALIDDLLQFSRNGRAEMTRAPVDMDEVVREVLSGLQALDRRQIRWTVGPLPPAWCDRSMLRLVWQNLIDNAVKFTGKKPEAAIEIGSLSEGGNTVYYIRDNGAGFDMRYAQKLFGVFQRMHTSDEFDGTGIGLATVKRIVSRHGGRIWAEAAVNQGAAFYFTLSKKEKAV